MIFPYQGRYPLIHSTVFLTDGVTIVGDVDLAEHVSVWFGAVVRRDVAPIRIGARTNVQDNCTLHVTWKKYPLTIGEDATIGHGAILHGCTVRDRVLIGMHATVLDNAVVQEESLIAAGTVVLQNAVVPAGVLYAGVPGKVIRELTEEERDSIAQSSRNYLHYVEEYRRHQDMEAGLSFEEYFERFTRQPADETLG